MTSITAKTNSPWINEGVPVEQGENASVPWSVKWPSASTVASPTVKVYKKGTTTDVAATVMPSGSHTASGNLLTMKNLTALTGGESYIISITITVDGVVDEFFMAVRCLKQETGQT
jgi:hypothetical protein